MAWDTVATPTQWWAYFAFEWNVLKESFVSAGYST